MVDEVRKLLLADDSITIQKVVDLTFADEGFAVTTVGNGEQAIEKLAELMPDIVLADVFMPGKSGYQVCEHIKRNAQFQHIPVILLVGSFEPFDETEARRVGADDVLTKPFQSIRQLVNKVGALLGGEEKNDADEHRDAAPPHSFADVTNATHDDSDVAAATAGDAALSLNNDADAPSGGDAPDAPFGDAAMDDEMIEATPADEFNHHHEPAHHAAPFSQTDVVEETHAAQAVETSDTNSQPEESSDASDETGDETLLSFAAPEVALSVHEEEASEPATHAEAHAFSSPMADAAAADEALLDLGDIAPQTGAAAEADDFILDLRDAMHDASPAAPSSMAVTAPSASFDADMDGAPLADFEEGMTDAAPQSVAYTEAQNTAEEQRTDYDLVDDRSADSFATTELQPSAAARAAFEGVGTTAHDEHVAAAPEISVPQWETPDTQTGTESSDASAAPQDTASPAATHVNLDQLSPEAIDRIARRVVEHLSENILREIAWEVVPQLAELMIKRRLEEEKSQTP